MKVYFPGLRKGFTFLALAAMTAAWGPSLLADEAVPLEVPRLAVNIPEPANIRSLREASDEVANTADDTADGGETEIIRERYPNGKIKIERQVTLDPDGNYVNHGGWKMWNKAGTLVAEGQYHMGHRVGAWTRWHGRKDSPLFNQFPFNRFKAPFVSQANFTEGVIDGDWFIVDADQRKCRQITIEMGKRHGLAITWLPNGEMLRQETYEHGVPVGDVLQLNNKTGKFERFASYVEGRKVVSKATNFHRSKQKKTESLYLAPQTVLSSPDDFWNMRFAQYEAIGEPLRHGPAKTWYSNGQIKSEGFYQYDKKVGRFTYWHANGQMAAMGDYRGDQRQGRWVWWHENGQKAAIGNYHDGVLAGEWRWWEPNGRLAKQKSYDGSQGITADDEQTLELGQQPSSTSDIRR